MKKIVGILAVAAMATSMFAAEVAAGLKVNTDMFNMEFKDGAKPTVLNAGLDSGGYYWGSRLQLAVSSDKAGGQLALSYHGWDAAKEGCTNGPNFYLHDYKVWFKPFDMLKISLLNQGDHLNNSYVDDKRVMHIDGAWKLDLTPIENLTVSATLGNEWVKAGEFQDTGLKVTYGADFGTVGAMAIAKTNFKAWTFGAGYSGTVGPASVFADAAVSLADSKAKDLAIDMQAKVAFEPVTFTCFALYGNTLANSGNAIADNSLLLRAKGEVKAGAATVYVEVKDDDLIADNFVMSVQPGVVFNVGAASCDFGAKVTIDPKGTSSISCPFTVGVNF